MARALSIIGRVLAAVLIVGTGVLGPAAIARAQSEKDDLSVSLFDGGNGRNAVEVRYTGASKPNLQITENGQPVKLDGAVTTVNRERGIVYVIDSGKGMNDGNVLPQVREAILAQSKQYPDIEYAVVQAGDTADIRTTFTREPARLASALDAIGPTQGSSIWNAVNVAASMLKERTRLQPSIVLVTADDDTVSPDGLAVARGAVLANATWLQNVLYTGPGSKLTDVGAYNALVTELGAGQAADDTRDKLVSHVRGAIQGVAERQYRATWTSSVPVGEPLHIEVAAGEARDTIDVLAGRGIYRGYQQLHPEIGAKQFALPLADNPLVYGLGLLLVLIGVAGAAYAITTSLVKDNLSNVLEPYADAYKMIEGDTEESQTVLSKNALLQKAVALTEQVAEQQGLLVRAEAALERANLPLRAGEALFTYVVIVLAATVIPLILTRNVIPALIFGILGAMIPPAVVNQIASRRRKSFMGQLPDTLSLLSGTLKAGYSLMQGVESVSKEVAEPMGLELRRVVTESRLGRPLEESMEASADRMDSPDFAWAVMAIRIQREVGGNLAELLLTVSDTMVARERLRRDVAALTAEGRVSAYMLAAMPPCLAGVMYVLNKAYVTTLFTDVLGLIMVGLASVSMVVGFLWMKKIITIEI